MKKLLQSQCFYKCIIFFGLIWTVSTIIVGWWGIEWGINLGITKIFRLVQNSTIWEVWKTVPFPVFIKFHFFNITNPKGIEVGEKPNLTEIGPYVYLVDFEKHDIEENETGHSVFYSPSRTYIFQPQLSSGEEDDQFNYINLFYIGVSHIAHDLTSLDIVLATLDDGLRQENETFTRTDTVKDVLWEGVSIQTYIDLINDPMVQRFGSIDFPAQFKDGHFALLKGKNGTKDGIWECDTGTKRSEDLGRIVCYNGNRELSLYKGPSCNSLNGTDGTLYPPFIIPGITPLDIFLPELCRSVQWEFETMWNFDGIPVARYKFPDIKSAKEDPEAWCFCPKDDPLECDTPGIANLAPCFDGVPLLYSKPHFLNAPGSIINAVDGLSPNAFFHESQLNVHPLTGVSVASSIKMQFSIEVVPWKAMPSFEKVSHAFVPFVWIELVPAPDESNFTSLKYFSLFMTLLPVIQWLSLLGSLGVIFMGSFFLYRCRKGYMSPAYASGDENSISHAQKRIQDFPEENAAPEESEF